MPEQHRSYDRPRSITNKRGNAESWLGVQHEHTRAWSSKIEETLKTAVLLEGTAAEIGPLLRGSMQSHKTVNADAALAMKVVYEHFFLACFDDRWDRVPG